MHRTRLNIAPENDSDDDFETEYGLMRGDDGGYTDFEQLCHEEDVARNFPSGSYKLLGDGWDREVGTAVDRLKQHKHDLMLDGLPFPDNKINGSDNGSDTGRTPEQRLAEVATGVLSNLNLRSSNPDGKKKSNDNIEGGPSDNVLPSRTMSGSSQEESDGVMADTNPLEDARRTYMKYNKNQQRDRRMLNTLQIVGNDNIVVRNVLTLQNVRNLRERALQEWTKSLRQSEPKPTLVKEEGLLLPVSTPEPAGIESNSKAPVKPDPDANVAGVAMAVDTTQRDNAKGENCNPSPTETGTESILEIRNEVTRRTVTRKCDDGQKWALTHGVCALLVAHSGFSHASEQTLHMLGDSMVHFIESVGRSLDTWQEDDHGAPMSLKDQMHIIGSAGFRGGLADLVSYAKADLVRAEQALREAQVKLTMRIDSFQGRYRNATMPRPVDEAPVPPIVSEPEKEQQEDEDGSTASNAVLVEDDAFAFGYLNHNVRLDVLGDIKVPWELVHAEGNERKMNETDDRMQTEC